MEFKDYYKILGVSKGASDDDIKAAYKKLARKYHPDVNPGDKAAEERFKDISEAKEVLLDPEKRRQYDDISDNWDYYSKAGPGAAGAWGQQAGTRTQPGYRRTTFTFGDLSDGDLSDFFKQFFGPFDVEPGAFGRARTGRGFPRSAPRDVEHELEIRLDEAFRGAQRSIEITDPSDGSSRRIVVTIPAGIRNGKKLRVAGEGAGPSGVRGDLYLNITIRENPRFQLKGDDLYTEVSVPLTDAILGGSVSLLTLGGEEVTATIPPETANGQMLRLRGQGMPSVGSTTRGDLYVKISVVLPKGLSERERELFRELADLRNATGRGPAV